MKRPILPAVLTLVVLLASSCDGLFGPSQVPFTFHKNDPDASGIMPTLYVAPGSTVNLPHCLFERSNYEFIGWSSVADGTVEYPDRAELSVLSEQEFYALWSPASDYAYTFDAGLASTWHAEDGNWAAASGALSNAATAPDTANDGSIWLDEFAGNGCIITLSLTLLEAGTSPMDSLAVRFFIENPLDDTIGDSGYALAIRRNGTAALFSANGDGTLTELAQATGLAVPTASSVSIDCRFGRIVVSYAGTQIMSVEDNSWIQGYPALTSVNIDGSTVGVNTSRWSVDNFTYRFW